RRGDRRAQRSLFARCDDLRDVGGQAAVFVADHGRLHHGTPARRPACVAAQLAEVVHLLLSKEAKDRPADAAAVAAELEAALGGRSPAARRRARRRALRNVAGAVALIAALGLL